MSKNFKYRIAIEGTESKLKEFIPKLEALGYSRSPVDENYPYAKNFLVTNRNRKKYHYGFFHSGTTLNRIVVPSTNENLCLALAAMVEGDEFHVGEYVTCSNANWHGNIYSINTVKDETILINYEHKGKKDTYSYCKDIMRKATYEEIVAYFTAKPVVVEDNTVSVVEFILPKKWCVKRNKKTYTELNKYFNAIRGHNGYTANGSKTQYDQDFDYLHIPISNGLTNTVYSKIQKGYTEITYQQFLDHVVNAKQTMKKEKGIIGYKFRRGYEKYTNAACSIEGYIQIGEVIRSEMIPIEKVEAIQKLRNAGVLDLWFEPVYGKRTVTVQIGKPVIDVTINDDGSISVSPYHDKFNISDVIGLISRIKNLSLGRIGHRNITTKVEKVHIGCEAGPDITLEELETIVNAYNGLQ